jgi:hypothetical protein
MRCAPSPCQVRNQPIAFHEIWHPSLVTSTGVLVLCPSVRMHNYITAGRVFIKFRIGRFCELTVELLELTLKSKGLAMAEAFSRRLLSTETRFRSQVSPCEICGSQSGTVTGLSQSTPVSPVSIIPPMLHSHSFIYHRRCIMFFSQYSSFPCQYHPTNAPYSSSTCCSYQKHKRAKFANFPKSNSLSEIGEHWLQK